MQTPWGKAQHVEEIASGIQRVHTAGHGGWKLDRKRNALIPSYMRRKGGWYEEDQEVILLSVVFPFLFQNFSKAKESLRDAYPDEYEKFFNEVIPPGMSRTKDEREFLEKNKDNWIVISAALDEANPEMVVCTATRGGGRLGRTQDGLVTRVVEKQFMVPKAEYAQRSRCGYVIQEEA